MSAHSDVISPYGLWNKSVPNGTVWQKGRDKKEWYIILVQKVVLSFPHKERERWRTARRMTDNPSPSPGYKHRICKRKETEGGKDWLSEK